MIRIRTFEFFGLSACAVVVCLSPSDAKAEITLGGGDHGALFTIRVDGNIFTKYILMAGHSPALWPIVGPTGAAVTRGFPFTPATKDGTHDHPHHQSLWFAHDDVNGVHFWATNVNDTKGDSGPHIVHRDEQFAWSAGEGPRVVVHDDWMDGDKRICNDSRTIVFGHTGSMGADDARWIDFSITIDASNGDVTFGDTKEGAFALRVADSMRVDAKQGGRIETSTGKVNESAWGMPARWVDYTGPVDGQTVGIAMMSHPKNFRPEPRWHVRTYGLFAANPFGEKDFPHVDGMKQGAFTIKKGQSLTLRYLVLLHRGKTDAAALEQMFGEFAKR